jgi:hypothetical protein
MVNEIEDGATAAIDLGPLNWNLLADGAYVDKFRMKKA